jgi:hypothetical protein
MLSGLYPLSQGAALLKENLRSIVVFLNYFVKFKKEKEDKIMSERNRTGGRSEPKEEENRIFCSRMPFFVFTSPSQIEYLHLLKVARNIYSFISTRGKLFTFHKIPI